MNAEYVKANLMTLTMCVIAVIVVLIGGITVVAGSYGSDYAQWVNDLVKLALGVGLLGVGRGISNHNDAKKLRGGAPIVRHEP